jgi:hypothetical protein
MKIGQTREATALHLILEGFGVPRDGSLIVHSAIGKLSRAGFRAEAISSCLP